jgi:hypothetical protein
MGLITTRLKLPAKVLVASLIMGVVIFPIQSLLGASLIDLIVVTVAGSAVYATVAVSIGIVSPARARAEVRRLLDWLRRTPPSNAAPGGPVEHD